MKNKKHQLSVLMTVLIAALISCSKKSGNPAEEIPEEPEVETPGTIAFPGAEGFGKYATGGRGGKVVEVTNLNDSGTGSFRDAFSKFPGEPITIIFKVGGIIHLNSELKISRSNITIAGQTAPGDGICLKGQSFIVNGAKNVIIRYIRSRPGDKDPSGVYGFGMENSSDVIIDHCSFSWANEECAAMYDNKNTTVQWCIMSEGLYNAGHAKGVRSYGGVWGGQYATYHHNLIAHNVSRTIRFNGARAHDTIAVVDYRNNVIYNWGANNACYGGEVQIPGGLSRANIVNNYYKPGPATRAYNFIGASYNTGEANVGQWYVNGNVMAGNAERTADNWLGVDLGSLQSDAHKSIARSKNAFAISEPLPVQSAETAYEEVLAKVGAVLPKRDAVDLRVVNETKTGTATGTGSYGKPGIIDDPSAVLGWPVYNTGTALVDTDKDGIPDTWEDANGLNKNNVEDGNKLHESGYTMLEMYLNSIK